MDQNHAAQVLGVGLRDPTAMGRLAEVMPAAQVYNLDDDGHDLGGCAPPGPPARPGAPGLALVLTCAGTPRGSAAVGAPAAAPSQFPAASTWQKASARHRSLRIPVKADTARAPVFTAA